MPYPLNWLYNHGRVGMAGMPYPPTGTYIKKNNHAASTAAWLSINSKVMTISFYSLRRYY